jgi:hypothetical protein
MEASRNLMVLVRRAGDLHAHIINQRS